MRRLLWIVILVLSCGAVALLRESRREVAPAKAVDVVGEDLETVEPPGALRMPLREPIATDPTLADFLSAFWGSRWEQLRSRYAEFALAGALKSSELREWTEVSEAAALKAREYWARDADFRLRVCFSKLESDQDSFKRAFHVDPELDLTPLLPQLESRLTEIDAELSALCYRYERELDRASEMVIARDPERSPLVDVASADPSGTFWTIQVEEGGWYVKYPFRYQDFPLLAELQRSKRDLTDRRFAALREFARGLP